MSLQTVHFQVRALHRPCKSLLCCTSCLSERHPHLPGLLPTFKNLQVILGSLLCLFHVSQLLTRQLQYIYLLSFLHPTTSPLNQTTKGIAVPGVPARLFYLDPEIFEGTDHVWDFSDSSNVPSTTLGTEYAQQRRKRAMRPIC